MAGCLGLCQSPNIIFIKLKLETYEPITMEWSVDNLVHNKTKIVKEIVKSCLGSNLWAVNVEYLVKVPKEGQFILGTSHLRVNKTYILVEEGRIHCLNPASVLLTSVFPAQSPFFEVFLLDFKSADQLIALFKKEMHAYMVFAIQEQRLSWAGWSLLLSNLYKFKENER